MVTVVVISYIFGSLAGIGAVCYFMGKILEKRNSIGDSHANPLMYTQLVTFTDCSKRMYPSQKSTIEYIESHPPRKATFPTAPRGDARVERPGNRR